MKFGDALKALELGKRLQRTGWNGKGLFVYLVPAASYQAQTGAAKEHFGEGAMVPYNAYFAIKNANETVSTWVPSVNDCLADDWIVVGCTVPPGQQHLLDEKQELDIRITRMHEIIRTTVFLSDTAAKQALQRRQLDVMQELSTILGERIQNP